MPRPSRTVRQGSALIEAGEAAFAKLRNSDPAAFLLQPRFPKGRICSQHLLVTLAVDHVLLRPGLGIGGCFTVTVRRAVCAWADGVVALDAKQATATARAIPFLIIFTLPTYASDVGASVYHSCIT